MCVYIMDKRIAQPLGTLPAAVGFLGNRITSGTQVLPEGLVWVFAGMDQLVMVECVPRRGLLNSRELND